MRSLIIRRFRRGDETGICMAHVRSVREICSHDYSPQQIESWIGKRKPQDYLQTIAKGERFWVLDDHGTIAGFSGWRGKSIRGFYMHPEYAGCGLGRRLFKTVEKDFRRYSGYKTCSIESSLTARLFYQRMGFKAVRRSKHAFRNGSRAGVWEMIKHYK